MVYWHNGPLKTQRHQKEKPIKKIVTRINKAIQALLPIALCFPRVWNTHNKNPWKNNYTQLLNFLQSMVILTQGVQVFYFTVRVQRNHRFLVKESEPLPFGWPRRQLERLGACHHGKLPCYHGEWRHLPVQPLDSCCHRHSGLDGSSTGRETHTGFL